MGIKKIAVIGSKYFSGSHFIDYLLDNTDWKIIGISRSLEYPEVFLPYFANKDKGKRFKFFKLDLVDDFKELSVLLDREKPEAVVNFAAQSNVPASWENPGDWFRTNCLGIVRIASHLNKTKYLLKYIQISTPEVYGPCRNFKEDLNYYNPTTPYAASKAAGDLFLIALSWTRGFPASFVRSANVYGSHQQPYRIIPSSVILIKKGKNIVLHGGAVKRNFIYIKDVADGILRVIKKGKPGQVYHFSSGDNMTIRELVKVICNSLGVLFKKTVQDSPTKSGRERDKIYHLNYAATQRELNWRPKTSLSDGIDEVSEWVDKYWNKLSKYPLEYIHKK